MILLKNVHGTKNRSDCMEIQREAYLNQLIERRDNGMIKIVTGIRRCGKSICCSPYSSGICLKAAFGGSYYRDRFGRHRERGAARPQGMLSLYHGCHARRRPYYLLLDEVQFMPRFEEVLNSLLRMSNIDVYVTGSNSKFLSSDIVTEFRGRGDDTHSSVVVCRVLFGLGRRL